MRRAWLALRLVMVAMVFAFAGCGSGNGAADEILEKNAEARGGLAAWRDVKSMTMTGKLEAGIARDPVKLARNFEPRAAPRSAAERRARLKHPPAAEAPVQLPFVLELARPRKSRLEITFKGENAVQVYDGKSGWKVRPFLGRHDVEPFTADELSLASAQADLDGPLLDASDKGSRVQLLGTEKVGGRDAYKLEVTPRSGAVRHVWVDTQTHLEVQVDGTRKLDGKARTVLTALRDYRKVDGLLVPHVLETTVEGVPGSEKILVEQVQLNAPLDGARFSKPE
ncbi:MAG: outer membrane lipoprotein-sorting protein [Myxococcales bacterium]